MKNKINESVFIKKKKKNKYTKKWVLSRSRFLFLFKILILKLRSNKKNVLFSQGVHFITAPSGSGKTLLSNYILRELTLNKNAFMWVNIDQYEKKITEHFIINDIFNNGSQSYKLPLQNEKKQYSKGVIIDEINLHFNRRENKKKDYNDIFIPLMSFLVTHRHQNQDRIYLLGQNRNLQDTQIQSVLKYQHRVFCSKKYKYFYFRERKKMVYAPIKLKVITFLNVGQNNVGDTEWQEIKTDKIKVTIELLETYNTHGFAEFVKDLPDYKRKEKK